MVISLCTKGCMYLCDDLKCTSNMYCPSKYVKVVVYVCL